jgi:hypothetical protein
MQNEITVKPLVDILSKQLSREVVMSGNGYVYLDTKAAIVQGDIDIALVEQTRLHSIALIPKVISKIQAMRAMKATGTLWVDFNTLLSSSQDAKDEWDLATELVYDNPFVLQLASALGLSSLQLENLFILADTL